MMLLEEVDCPCCAAPIVMGQVGKSGRVPLQRVIVDLFSEAGGGLFAVTLEGKTIRGRLAKNGEAVTKARLAHYAECPNADELRAWVRDRKGGIPGGMGGSHPHAPRTSPTCDRCSCTIEFVKAGKRWVAVDPTARPMKPTTGHPDEDQKALAHYGDRVQLMEPCREGEEGSVRAKVMHRYTCGKTPAQLPEIKTQTPKSATPRLAPERHAVMKRAMGKLATALRHAKEGGRNTALYNAAHAAGRFSAAGAFSMERTKERLWEYAQEVGLDEKEFDKTFKSAFGVGFKQPWKWRTPKSDSPEMKKSAA